LLEENRTWPGALGDLLHVSTFKEVRRLQYATERYYANQLKATDDDAVLDQLLTLAYLRVVHLQFLRNESDMGFTERQFRFVLAAVKQYQDISGCEPHILELGCGAGSLLVSLAQESYRSIAGVDISHSAIELARTRLSEYGLADNVQQGTLIDLIKSGLTGTFDIILMCDVLEHVPPSRVAALLADARRLLQIGGYLIIITPNSFAGPHDITRYFQPRGSAPEGLHLREYSLRELTELLTKSGFDHFKGLRLRDCVGFPSEPQLSSYALSIRLAMERFFPYMPSSLSRRAVSELYFSAVYAQVAPDRGVAGTRRSSRSGWPLP
jgi:2-polyprenyl-3-methyl-5-hydroxy-6-metoxy-1,4-benzoquinol methylase